GSRVLLDRQRLAEGELHDVLDPGAPGANFARPQLLGRKLGGREDPDVVYRRLRSRLQAEDRLALLERAVDDADVRDHAAVLVVLGVEDQRARRRGGVAVRRRNALDDLLQQLVHALAGLGRDAADLVGGLADQLRDLLPHALGLGAGQV